LEARRIRTRGNNLAVEPERGEGFTLIELLVVLACISLLMAIAAPTVRMVYRQAGSVVGISNQRQIVAAVNLFAIDNNGRYPKSVAIIGVGSSRLWHDPRMMTAYGGLSSGPHRAMSEYLREYIRDADAMFCPSAPRKYKHLQQAWDDGDEWDNPDTPPSGATPDPVDPLFGSYCFYWNYTGCLEDGVFRGPRLLSGRQGRSGLLVTDYFGYDHWRSPDSYGSCEHFKGAGVTEGSDVSSAYWSGPECDGPTREVPNVKLGAGFADGHVRTYTARETVPMKVAATADGTGAWPDGVHGIFYLPRSGLR
jgi:prepilin-type N-terminal cleavage/methylation domain-containing protein